MKIIHTADLHLGQVIYQNYDRTDEHRHFFRQLEQWCREERPDALVVSGDVFDIQQPSAAVRRFFTDHFVSLHRQCPEMQIVIVAGNHDSASRLHADHSVWRLANTRIVGMGPAIERLSGPDGWQDDYIVRLPSGFIVALPYMVGDRQKLIQSILDRVAAANTEGLPVVMTGHLTVTGADATGHSFEIGKVKTASIESLGEGYDYLALGHIHKPQTINHEQEPTDQAITYASPVVRYSGSALHVSCDETYPHTVSIVDIDRRGGSVTVRQRRIDELYHFYVLPLDGTAFATDDEALEAIGQFRADHSSGYIRLRMSQKAYLPDNFNQLVYQLLQGDTDAYRYNPKHIWLDEGERQAEETQKPAFEVAELQQMTDPTTFVERIIDQYPDLDIDLVRAAFQEVKEEIRNNHED